MGGKQRVRRVNARVHVGGARHGDEISRNNGIDVLSAEGLNFGYKLNNDRLFQLVVSLFTIKVILL